MEIAKVVPPRCDAGDLKVVQDVVAERCARKGCGKPRDARYHTVFCEDHLLIGHDVEVVQDVVPPDLRATHGVPDGVPALDAIPEEAEQPNDGQPVAVWEGDTELLGIPQPDAATTKCECLGCTLLAAPGDSMCVGHRRHWGVGGERIGIPQPYSATTTCRMCGDFTPCACGAVSVCLGIPIAQGPDEACTCALGPGLERCVVCAEWMQRCGRCDGCCGHLPGWTVTGYLCKECRDLRLVTKRRPESLAERIRAILDDAEGRAWREVAECHDPRSAQMILAEATEQAWQALAESPDLDPLTVGVCKRLRDMERGR